MVLTKSQAEEIVRRALAGAEALADQDSDHQTLSAELVRDLGVLGRSIQFQLEKDEMYQGSFQTLSAENVRLNMTVTTLAMQIGEISEHLESVAGQLHQYEEAFAAMQAEPEPAEETEPSLVEQLVLE